MILKLSKIHFTFFILFLGFTSCDKKKADVSQKQKIENITALKNYKILSKTKKNDSIDYIIGENKYFTISGNFNNKRNKKTDWWIVKEQKSTKSLKIQYIIFGNELFKNQVIFLNRNQIDTLSSKFYSIKNNLEDNKIDIFFNSPPNKDEKLIKCHLRYYLYHNDDNLGNDSINCNGVNGKYFATISLKKTRKVNFVKGYITEYTSRKIDKDSMDLSANSIYFLDDLDKVISNK